jgi:hypothetical protein
MVEILEDGMAANLRQAHLLRNHTPQVDSVADLFAEIHRSSTNVRVRALARQGLLLTRDVHDANVAERTHWIATMDALREESERPAGGTEAGVEWSLRRAVRELRGPLGVLTNPIVKGERHDEALGQVRRVVQDAPRELLIVGASVKPTLAHELGVAKSTVLLDVIQEMDAAVVVAPVNSAPVTAEDFVPSMSGMSWRNAPSDGFRCSSEVTS